MQRKIYILRGEASSTQSGMSLTNLKSDDLPASSLENNLTIVWKI
jgi:hypothetical protein